VIQNKLDERNLERINLEEVLKEILARLRLPIVFYGIRRIEPVAETAV